MPEWDRVSDLKLWELNENSTRFDEASAAPSIDNLYIQWIGTATISGTAAFFTFLLMVSILRVREVRTKSFNCYILAVLFPDFEFALSCCITCAVNAANRRYMGEAMCGWQTWYAVFGLTASCWMNAVISHQLFTMLRVSHSRGGYVAPSIRYVAKQTLAVYTYAACLASAGTWNIWGIPYKGGLYQGYACLVKDYDDASTIFFWLGFLPMCVLIPLVYVISCFVRIYRGGMLPPPGQRSTLYMYFSLIFVFVFMWLPFIVITFAWGPARPGVDSTWVLWVGAQFSHLQGLATVWTILFKLDIRAAFLGTISCGKLTVELRPNPANRPRRPRSRTYDGNTRITELRVSGSMLQSMASQPSRASSIDNRNEDRLPSGLDSINDVFGNVPPGGDNTEDKEIQEKEMGLPASEKRLGSSSDDSDNVQVQQNESGSDEELGMANPASSSSGSSGRPSLTFTVDSFVENDLSVIADRVPTEMQRVVYEESVTLGVGGVGDDNIIRFPADVDERAVTPLSDDDASKANVVSSDIDNDFHRVVDCLPSDMQRMIYEDAVTLGIGGTGIVRPLDSEIRATDSSSRSRCTFRENGPGIIADCPPSATDLKTQKDSRVLQSSLHSDDEKKSSASVSSDDSFFSKLFSKIFNVPTPSQQMLFEDAVALQIDCSELIREEEDGNNIVL